VQPPGRRGTKPRRTTSDKRPASGDLHTGVRLMETVGGA
jgi:hypothetical protein